MRIITVSEPVKGKPEVDVLAAGAAVVAKLVAPSKSCTFALLTDSARETV